MVLPRLARGPLASRTVLDLTEPVLFALLNSSFKLMYSLTQTYSGAQPSMLAYAKAPHYDG